MEKRQKYGGRKKGSLNKVNSSIKEVFQHLIESNLEQLKYDIAELEPKDRISAILQLTKYVLPALRSIEQKNTHDFEPTKINIISLGSGAIPPEDKEGEVNICFTEGVKATM